MSQTHLKTGLELNFGRGPDAKWEVEEVTCRNLISFSRFIIVFFFFWQNKNKKQKKPLWYIECKPDSLLSMADNNNDI